MQEAGDGGFIITGQAESEGDGGLYLLKVDREVIGSGSGISEARGGRWGIMLSRRRMGAISLAARLRRRERATATW